MKTTSLTSVTPQTQSATQLSAVGFADDTRLLWLAESVGNMGHWYWVLATGRVQCSEQTAHITGRPTGPDGKSIEEALEQFHLEDRALVTAQLDQCIASRVPTEIEARVIRPTGDVRHVVMKCQPEYSPDGQPVALFGVMSDITDAVNALQSVNEQREMFDIAANMAHLGHWVWSASTNSITTCSEQLARIHELTVEVFLSRFAHPTDIASVIDASQRRTYLSLVSNALAHGKEYAIEYRMQTRFAATRHVKEIGQPTFDESGALVRFVGTVQDVTEAKLREEQLTAANLALENQAVALSRSEAKFRDIVQSSIQGIIIFRGPKPLFANQAFAKLAGVATVDELLALEDVRLLLPKGKSANSELFWAKANRRELDGVVSRTEMRSIDGRLIWIDALGRLIDWEGAPAFMLTVVDVTSRHLADVALQQKSQQLETLNAEKDKLFSIIAHDLKGPFNSVLGVAGLLAAKAASLPPEKVSEYADIVYAAATSVHDLLDNLLAWASVQMRSSELQISSIDLRALAESSFYPLATAASSKGVTFENGIKSGKAVGDESMIRIVMRNLISNGIKFTARGGKVSVFAEQSPLPDGRMGVVISVRDNGVGMDPKTLSDLFNFSRKISRPGTQGERGTGLGLSLCHDIVARHGGILSVDSEAGRGTVFRFTLPATENKP